MKLILSILVAGFLGSLAFFGPIVIYILSAIIIGVIFRSFILLHEIHKQIVPANSNDRVKDVYDRYIEERDKKDTEM